MKKREEMQVNVAGLRRNIKNIAHNYSDAQVSILFNWWCVFAYYELSYKLYIGVYYYKCMEQHFDLVYFLCIHISYASKIKLLK